MSIRFASTILATPSVAAGRIGPSGITLNGQPVADIWQAVGADYATVFGRGDGPVELGFSVTRLFSSEAAMLTFVGTHREALPNQDDLYWTDEAESVALLLEDALREVRFSALTARSVRVDYKFTGSRFVTDDVPEAPTDSDTVKAGIEDLSVDDATKAIAFPVAFASAPRFVDAKVVVPTAGDDGFDAWPVESSITAAGFTVKLGALVPAAGYKLRWMALL